MTLEEAVKKVFETRCVSDDRKLQAILLLIHGVNYDEVINLVDAMDRAQNWTNLSERQLFFEQRQSEDAKSDFDNFCKSHEQQGEAAP